MMRSVWGGAGKRVSAREQEDGGECVLAHSGWDVTCWSGCVRKLGGEFTRRDAQHLIRSVGASDMLGYRPHLLCFTCDNHVESIDLHKIQRAIANCTRYGYSDLYQAKYLDTATK